ncbi:50S ribosomal protein L11 methyltransferase [Peptoniphilus sp.]|uniref:50S ribosomal protein L11 methyltransferase n=1 Tax=Peptoniphilus sp. TaxID=1971214 RepID=UPI00399115BF
MKYIEFKIETDTSHKEDVLNILYDNDLFEYMESSKEVIDELGRSKDSWDFVDENVLNIDSDVVELTAFPEDEEMAKNLINLLQSIDNTKSSYLIKDDEDWANNWKKYYHQVPVGDKLLIKPSWEDLEDEFKDRLIVEIDPGMAFGTGTHETTYMCLEALEKYVKDDDVVFDVGCGSGILGIAAAKLGAQEIVAVDLDEKCVETSIENAKLNGVKGKMEVHLGNLLDVVDGTANIIVSNIIAEIITGLVFDLREHLVPNGIFIASGIIEEKIPMVVDELERNEFEILDIKKKNGWSLIIGRSIDV